MSHQWKFIPRTGAIMRRKLVCLLCGLVCYDEGLHVTAPSPGVGETTYTYRHDRCRAIRC